LSGDGCERCHSPGFSLEGLDVVCRRRQIPSDWQSLAEAVTAGPLQPGPAAWLLAVQWQAELQRRPDSAREVAAEAIIALMEICEWGYLFDAPTPGGCVTAPEIRSDTPE
jgi:hypothetical protein